MKKIITSILLLFVVGLQAQTIDVNGSKIQANQRNTFPLWLSAGSTVAPEFPVVSISAIEFTLVQSIEGTNMVFSTIKEITTSQTVPEGTTWKIESVQTANESFNDSLSVLSQQLDSVLNAPCTALYQVGDMVEGGIVFYVDATGEHGLVAATEDLDQSYEWGCYGESVEIADDNSQIGTGLENTNAIVDQNCQTEDGGITAAQAALDAEINGYSDWYLPSRDELYQMYLNIGQGGLNANNNIGSFSSSYYWSSSEGSSSFAWVVLFSNGSSYCIYKYNSTRVRVIRAF